MKLSEITRTINWRSELFYYSFS